MTGLDRSTGANRQLLDDIQGVSRPDTDVVGLNHHDPYLANDRDDAQETSFALQTAGVIQGRDSLSGHIYDHHRIPVAKST